MLDGIYRNPTAIFFGRGCAAQLGAQVRQHAQRALLLYGGGSIKRNGVHGYVVDALQSAGVEYVELHGVVPNPRADVVREGIRLCREKSLDFILAVGGGSVIDSAKAIAIAVRHDGDPIELFLGAPLPQKALGVGTVLTIPGAGSESSPDTVITFAENQQKLALSSPLLYPQFSFLNPEFTFTLDRQQTMTGIADAIGHVLERYFTTTASVDCSDRLAEGLIATLMKYARLLSDEPQNYDYRGEAMWACKLAHDNTVGFGRKQDWATHRIAHEVAAIYDTVHGATLSTLFPAWMDHCRTQRPQRFAQLAERVFGVSGDAAELLRSFYRAVDLPTTLREQGVTDRSRFADIATSCVARQQSGTLGNFVRLAPPDIMRILDAAF